MAQTAAETAWRLNRINSVGHEWKLGDLVIGTELTGTVTLSGFVDGETAIFEVDHSAEGTFVDYPMAVFDAAPGFTIRPCCDGTDGGQFRFEVTYTAAEYVYYHGAEHGVGGGAVLSWKRRGIVLQH